MSEIDSKRPLISWLALMADSTTNKPDVRIVPVNADWFGLRRGHLRGHLLQLCLGAFFTKRPAVLLDQQPSEITEERPMVAFRLRVARHGRVKLLRARNVDVNRTTL